MTAVYRYTMVAFVVILGAYSGVFAQTGLPHVQPANRVVMVDEEGVLRWRDDGAEVCLFGVNYYAPHVLDYGNLTAVGAPIEETIDRDLAHFVRMGFDALRLHVFDREISDKDGNLIDNEHLQLLDYLIAHAKERGIYTVLTPIAWWGTQYSAGGFSDHYTMQEMTADPQAREAQCRYLGQFMEHVNRYTGLAYKDEPAVPVFELINEPLYEPEVTDSQVVEYIDALTDAVRKTGCAKPIFYNGWCERHAAVRDSKADGCTFGWYPTGLVAGRSLKGNYLPRVDDYPSMRSDELAHKAKIVYEFDAADVPGSYLYAAMARAFRGGGAQIATQFQYEPLPIGAFNAGWVTHYLNLAYTPHRAIGFMIAGEAFHRVPRLAQFGAYPDNTRFGEFRVSYEEDLAEMVSETAFLYSNDTATQPPSADKLNRIVGCGSSPLIRYEGTGAYFLDKLADGVWRLEVYPDAVWVTDPFSLTPSVEREVSRVLWRERRFSVKLPDLGAAFRIEALNATNTYAGEAKDGSFAVEPGVYLLSRPGAEFDAPAHAQTGRLGLREFVAPAPTDGELVVLHAPLTEAVEGQPVEVTATIVGEDEPEAATLLVAQNDAKDSSTLSMKQTGPYSYAAQIPADWVQAGRLSYALAVEMNGQARSFPWNLPTLPSSASVRPTTRVLLDGWREGAPTMTAGTCEAVSSSREGVKALRMTAPGFDKGAATGVRFAVSDEWTRPTGVALPDDEDWFLVVRARNLQPQTRAVEVGLIDAAGKAYGTDVELSDGWYDVRVPVKALRPLWGTKGPGLAVDDVKEISLIFGAWLYGADAALPHGLEVERIALESPSLFWDVPVLRRDAPVVLFDAARHKVNARGSRLYIKQVLVAGSKPDAPALRVAVEKFEQPPSGVSFRNDYEDNSEALRLRSDMLPRCNAVRITARAREPYTNALELTLVEQDGTPWGTAVPLTTEWRNIDIPLSQLRFFAHWNSAPEGRGQEGDAVRTTSIACVNVCFGAWLYPDCVGKPHTIEVERIVLVAE